jgi:cytochrome c
MRPPVPEEHSKLRYLTLSRTIGAILITIAALPVSGRAQDPAGGKELFEKRCGGCHALDRDKEGPRLRGVYGRAAALTESFEYSAALKKSQITWTGEILDRWLSDTEKLVPNNDMTYRVEKADERRDIIAYLKRNSGK